MKDEFSLFLVKKLEGDISILHNKMHNIDKLVLSLEHRISAVNSRLDKEEKEIDKLHDRKIGTFLIKNWSKLPSLAAVIGGLLWGANWLYDLPSPAQEKEIARMMQEKENANKKNK